MKFKMDYKWEALSVTTVGSLMASLDTTIVVIALPTILQDLHASIIHGIWIITGYTLMMTILLIMLGRLGDLYGRVKLYNLGFAVFTAGSLLCALSRTGEQLIIFRSEDDTSDHARSIGRFVRQGQTLQFGLCSIYCRFTPLRFISNRRAIDHFQIGRRYF